MLDAQVLKQHFPFLELPGTQGVIQLYDLQGVNRWQLSWWHYSNRSKLVVQSLTARAMPQALGKILYRPGASQPRAASHSSAGHRGIIDTATAAPCCSSESLAEALCPGAMGRLGERGRAWGGHAMGSCSLHRCTLWFRAPPSSPGILVLMWCWSDPSMRSALCTASPISPQICTPPRPGGRNHLALEAHPMASICAGEHQTGLAWADPRVEGGMWTTAAHMK